MKPRLYLISTGDGGGVRSRTDNSESSVLVRYVDKNGKRQLIATISITLDERGEPHMRVTTTIDDCVLEKGEQDARKCNV